MGETAAEVGQFFVVGDQDAAFTRRDVLGDLKAESAATAPSAGTATVQLTSPGMGGIFQHHEIVLGGQGIKSGHVRHQARHVNRNDRPRARCDLACNIFGIKAERVGLNVGKDGDGAEVIAALAVAINE